MDPNAEPKPKLRGWLPWASLGVAVLAFLLLMVIPGFGYSFAFALQIAPFAWGAALLLVILSLGSRQPPRWPAYAAIFVLISPVLLGLAALGLMGLR